MLTSILKIGETAYFRSNNELIAGNCEIILFHRSVGSAIRSICALCRPIPNGTKVRNALLLA